MKWTDWERKLMWRLKDGGLSDSATAIVLSRVLDWPVYSDEVSLEWLACRSNGFTRRMHRARKRPEMAGVTQDDTRPGRIVSCLLHRADLYRAGHQPGCGELEIASDGHLVVPKPTADTQSYLGSSASMCAEVM